MPLSSNLTVTLQVALTTNPGDVPTWTTVASNTTKKLRSWKIDRGRSAIFDQFPAGKATFVLDNRDRTFDPLHTAGPYYGNLTPMKRVRLQVTYAGTTYTRFDGFVDGWPQSYLANGRDAVVQLQATDAFKWLGRNRVPSVWEQVMRAQAPLSWWRLGESAGTTMDDSSGNGHAGVYEGGATFATRAGMVANDSDAAIDFNALGVQGVVRLSDHSTAAVTAFPFAVTGWFIIPTANQGRTMWSQRPSPGVGNGYMTVQVSGTGGLADSIFTGIVDATGDNKRTWQSANTFADGLPHFLAVNWYSDGSIDMWVDAVYQTVSLYSTAGAAPGIQSATGAQYVGASSTLAATFDEVAIFARHLISTDVEALYAAGTAPWGGDAPGVRATKILDAISWPAADRSISTGSASLGPAALQADALSHLQPVADSEGGRLFVSRDGKVTLLGRGDYWAAAMYNTSQATFGDGGGSELPYSGLEIDESDVRVRNDVTINPAAGSVVNRQDATSQTKYGPISLAQDTLETRPPFVQAQAEWLLAKLKDAAPEVTSITIDPLRSPAALFPVVLGAELGYRYTVVRRPQGVGAAISRDVQLEGTSESGSADRYTLQWALSPAEPAAWIAGTSTAGVSTVPGF